MRPRYNPGGDPKWRMNMKFFLKMFREKKLAGSVSLFAAMIFLMVVSVITATIKSARIAGAKVMVSCGLNSALDSVFSAYDSELFSQFGVLLFDGKCGKSEFSEDAICGLISDYMNYTIDPTDDLISWDTTDLYGINAEGVTLSNVIRATDGSGLVWENTVVEYEKYAKVINLAADYLGMEDDSEEGEAVSEINDKIIETTEKMVEIEKNARSLVKYLEGVNIGRKGVDLDDLKMVGRFVKEFCIDRISMNELSISNRKVFEKVEGEVDKTVSGIVSELKESCEDDRKLNFNILKNKLASMAGDAIWASQKVLDYAEKVNSGITDFKENVFELDDLLNSKSDVLSDEVENALTSDVEELKEVDRIIAQDICDPILIEAVMRSNIAVLEAFRESIKSVEMKNDEDGDGKTEETFAQIDAAVSILSGYTLAGTQVDYTTLMKDSSDESILDGIKNLLEKGLLGLVVPSGTAISGKKIEVNDLASTVVDTSNVSELQRSADFLTTQAKRIIYIEYVMDNFGNFLSEEGGPALDYEAEYILCGKESDADNLLSTVLRMATIRSGINLVYLFTDSAKRESCYGLATTIAGASGMEPVIRLVQFTLMYLWSYAEAICDVKTLLAGNTIGWGKTEDTWKLSLENLIAGNLEAGEGTGRSTDLSYEKFLRFLLYFENDGKRSVYTMDLVELFMIASGDDKFRLKDYVYGVDVTAMYCLGQPLYAQGVLLNRKTEYASYTY